MAVVKSAYLEYHSDEENSHKFYRIEMKSGDDGAFTVDATYGRVGSTGKPAPKYAGDSEATANAAYDKALNEKLRGNYQPVPDPAAV
jgi:predicted DNA-binding WGR domain protein